MTKNDVPNIPVIVNHVADSCLHYPGETVTFYTRLSINRAVSNLALRISLPRGLELTAYHAPLNYTAQVPHVETTEETGYLVWTPDYRLSAGTHYEFETQAVIAPVAETVTLTSRAEVMNDDNTAVAQEGTALTIRTKGQYLQYLPAVFEKDELMGRFLMLFESFWQPIEGQIDALPYYFDPRTTPSSFLPWLASWLDLELDERWSEAQVRQLIRWAIALHRSRGTKWGLLKYLEIYTGQRANVTEQISNNFVWGPEARLGSIALGRGNQPHTFTVKLRLPEPDASNAPEKARAEKIIRRTVESIINMQKPAHTLYTLDLAFIPPAELQAAPPEQNESTEVTPAVDEVTAQAATWFRLD